MTGTALVTRIAPTPVMFRLELPAMSLSTAVPRAGRLTTIDVVGVFDSYAAAEDAWRGKAQGTVDDAEMKYVVVHLHRLLQPDLLAPPAA